MSCYAESALVLAVTACPGLPVRWAGAPAHDLVL